MESGESAAETVGLGETTPGCMKGSVTKQTSQEEEVTAKRGPT